MHMTNLGEKGIKSDDRPALRTDKIEVSPEMIRAGALAFVSYDPRFEEVEEVVCRIYRAMRELDSTNDSRDG
jgi:hypothetical protein